MTQRLTQNEWLQHGLEILAEKGVEALKAEPLAKSLNVSRGSFYWHFQDIDMYRQKLLELWRSQATEHVIAKISAYETATDQLTSLILYAFGSEIRLERAVRAWSMQQEDAAQIVAVVDKERIDFIAQILTANAVPAVPALQRANFLYWAYLGRAMVPHETGQTLQLTLVEDVMKMLLSPDL